MTPPAATEMTGVVRAQLAAALLAIDPSGFGGALIRTSRYDAVERWLADLRSTAS